MMRSVTGRAWVWMIPLACLLLFSTYLRFHDNGQKLFWFDELFTALWYSGHDLAQARPELTGHALSPSELTSLLRLDEGSDFSSIIKVIIADDPQHTPLYFLALRLWSGVAGDSIAALRSLSAIADLLILPFLFWLCIELFQSRRVAWIAVALVGISPFHIVYSQEARQYTMWMLLIVASSALLLSAMRAPRWWKWFVYALMVTAGLYTHLLFCLVVMAHAVYVGGMFCLHRSGNSRQDARKLICYALATACGLIFFSPWVWVILSHISTATERLSWSERNVSFLHLAGMWAYNYSAVFLDTNHAMKFIDRPGLVVYGAFAARALILIPVALAVLKLLRDPRQKASLFLLPLILLPFLGLALPDVLFGGMRSGGGNRYLAGSFLGVQVALAYWLGAKPVTAGAWQGKAMAGTLAVILAMGVFSGMIFRQSETWWHKTIGHFHPDVARIVNADARPLLVSPSVTDLLSLSVSLRKHATVLLTEDVEDIGSAQQYSTVYVLSPSAHMQTEFTRVYGSALEPVLPRAKLFVLDRRKLGSE